MSRSFAAIGSLAVLLTVAPSPAGAAGPLTNPIPRAIPKGRITIALQPVASGLVAPNWGITAPGDSARLFVSDQPGILYAVTLANGTKTVFLNTSSLLVPLGIAGPGSYDERGFLGFAFHPSYATNGLLYTYTSEPVNGAADFSTMPPLTVANHQSVVREWHVNDPTNPASVVDPLSARVLLRIDKPQFNHNAGGLNFGPDGMLYISLGDGGEADDQGVGHGPNGNAQDLGAILGKILRIDVAGSNSANGQYGVPADNPFVGQVGALSEIFAYGFRNPFRFSFDRTMGDLWVGDVGQNSIEEVDVVRGGGNYGWRLKEGSFFFDPNGAGDGFVTRMNPGGLPSDLINPVGQYDHDEGIAIIGGFVYRGAAIPKLQGRYVFGDLARQFASDGRLFFLRRKNVVRASGRVGKSRPNEFQLDGQPALGLFLLGFGEDASGELYVLANGTGTPGGTTGVILKIVPPS